MGRAKVTAQRLNLRAAEGPMLTGKPLARAACVVALAVLASCGGVKPSVDPTRDTSMDGILRLIGRFSAAHACPVSETVALTSAHVIDLRPFDPRIGLFPYRYSTPQGDEGIVSNGVVDRNSDIGAVSTGTAFKSWYVMATEKPKAGDRLKYMAFDFEKRGHAYEEKPRHGVVERVVAGHVVMSVGGPRGSSGSCVLNERNEVVAVNSWVHTFDSFQESTGVAVGVWGAWVR